MMERKEKDGTGDFKDIHKHKNDIYRLTTILIVPSPIKLPAIYKNILQHS